jgi:hypothetical protein
MYKKTDVDLNNDIQVWISDVDEPVASFNKSELLVVPGIGDAIKLPLNKEDSEYFRVVERYIAPSSHCSLMVVPISGKGFEYKQALMLTSSTEA